ncbi:hypothetical protein [Methylobacter sp.]
MIINTAESGRVGAAIEMLKVMEKVMPEAGSYFAQFDGNTDALVEAAQRASLDSRPAAKGRLRAVAVEAKEGESA